MTPEDKSAYALSKYPQRAGVEGTEEMLRWIWNEGFAAVASDAISFEIYPPQKNYKREDGPEVESVFCTSTCSQAGDCQLEIMAIAAHLAVLLVWTGLAWSSKVGRPVHILEPF